MNVESGYNDNENNNGYLNWIRVITVSTRIALTRIIRWNHGVQGNRL